jgi:hypothetical protein
MELILASGEGYRLCEPQVRLEKSSWKRGDQEATFDPTFIDPWYGYDRGGTQDTLSLKLKIRYIIIRVLSSLRLSFRFPAERG